MYGSCTYATTKETLFWVTAPYAFLADLNYIHLQVFKKGAIALNVCLCRFYLFHCHKVEIQNVTT